MRTCAWLFLTFLLGYNSASAAVEHVVVIGIDGLSAEAVAKGNIPVLRKLMERGVYSLHARAVMPTSSSPNWASMIMGAGPEQHGITSNDWETNRFDVKPVTAGPTGVFPTIFGITRAQRPDAKIACFHDWEGFGRLVERDAFHTIKHVKDAIETAQAATKYFRTNQPTFLFVHFDGVDHAGHAFGWGTPIYYKSLELADGLIGEILRVIEESGVTDRTAVLVTSDHGGRGMSHGGATMEEIEIPWILAGPGIHRGRELKQSINTFDTAPTLARLLGVKPPKAWIGKVVEEAFEKNKSENVSP